MNNLVKYKRNKRVDLFKNSIIQIFLIIWATIEFYPLFWLFYTSFKTTPDIKSNIFAFPKYLYLGNFDFESFNYLGVTLATYYKNSIIITITKYSVLYILI